MLNNIPREQSAALSIAFFGLGGIGLSALLATQSYQFRQVIAVGVPYFDELYQQQRLPIERLLSNQYPLDRINEAMGDLDQRKVARALIAMV